MKEAGENASGAAAMRSREACWVHRQGRADRGVHQPVTEAAGHAGGRGAMIGTMGPVAGVDAVADGAAGRGAGGVVARPRLFGRLAAQARVAVVSAPPGSGKTVLLRTSILELSLIHI